MDASAVALLVLGGVTHLSLTAPVVDHPEVVPAGPPLTHDDLLDLHSALACDAWIDQLVGRTPTPELSPARVAARARATWVSSSRSRAGKSGTSRPRSSRSRRKASSVAACWKSRSARAPLPAVLPARPSRPPAVVAAARRASARPRGSSHPASHVRREARRHGRALPAAGPGRDGHGQRERRHHDQDVAGEEAGEPGQRRQVPEAVQHHGQQVAAQRRQDPGRRVVGASPRCPARCRSSR